MATPIEFPEQTDIIAKDQKEYLPLPAHVNRESDWREVTSCWKLTWYERILILFTGRVWSTLMTFGGPVQPQIIRIESPFNRK